MTKSPKRSRRHAFEVCCLIIVTTIFAEEASTSNTCIIIIIGAALLRLSSGLTTCSWGCSTGWGSTTTATAWDSLQQFVSFFKGFLQAATGHLLNKVLKTLLFVLSDIDTDGRKDFLAVSHVGCCVSASNGKHVSSNNLHDIEKSPPPC